MYSFNSLVKPYCKWPPIPDPIRSVAIVNDHSYFSRIKFLKIKKNHRNLTKTSFLNDITQKMSFRSILAQEAFDWYKKHPLGDISTRRYILIWYFEYHIKLLMWINVSFKIQKQHIIEHSICIKWTFGIQEAYLENICLIIYKLINKNICLLNLKTCFVQINSHIW